ncbi:MAG: hypothetical protein KGZ69_08805 [Methylomonas sp.]|nr:hypothetical protein [Methylomonas sp.]
MADEKDDDKFEPILSDEERAALEGDDDGADEGDDGDIEAGDDDDAESAQDGKPASASSENTDASANADAGDDGNGSGDDAGAGDDDGGEGPTVVDAPLRAAPVDQAKAALAVLDDKEADLQTRFDEGDITSGELASGLKEIAKNRGEIEWQMRKNELAEEMTAQARDNAWFAEVGRFMNGPGKAITASESMKLAFDSVVRKVTADANNQNLSDRQMLDKAHRIFTSDIAALTGGKEAPQKSGTTKEAGKQPRRVQAPPTLANVPSAEIESADGGEFAALDRLAESNPVKFEKAFAKLSASQQQAYLEAN